MSVGLVVNCNLTALHFKLHFGLVPRLQQTQCSTLQPNNYGDRIMGAENFDS